jgi:hypothetical protein
MPKMAMNIIEPSVPKNGEDSDGDEDFREDTNFHQYWKHQSSHFPSPKSGDISTKGKNFARTSSNILSPSAGPNKNATTYTEPIIAPNNVMVNGSKGSMA